MMCLGTAHEVRHMNGALIKQCFLQSCAEPTEDSANFLAAPQNGIRRNNENGEFHGRPGIPIGYAETRNMVFLKPTRM
jgi:hypothetical protein